MKPTSFQPEFPDHELDQRMLDRLVDGELTASEYDELLRKLERAPAGWRRCALAFLEAQAWGAELRTSGPRLFDGEAVAKDRGTLDGAGERAGEAAIDSSRAGGYPSWNWRSGSILALACAASFALAFVWSAWLRPGNPSAPEPEQVVGVDHIGERQGRESESWSPPSGTRPELAAIPALPPSLGRYRLVFQRDSGSPQVVEMPLFQADDPRAIRLLDEQATLPRELIRQLEQRGHQVQTHREWVPAAGEGGTQIYVPVDELRVTPVVHRAY